MEKSVSVICCYNDRRMFEEMLSRSLRLQTMDYELIGIDNTSGIFTCASKALNYGASVSSGKILLFIHQDMVMGKDVLKDTISFLKSHETAIAGFAGQGRNGTYTNILHGEGKKEAGSSCIHSFMEVETLDECGIALTKTLFCQLGGFSEEICEGWHLYAVELCLRARQSNIRSYVLPVEIYHRSEGTMDLSYLRTMDKIVQRYRRQYDMIFSTCSAYSTGYFRYSCSRLRKAAHIVARSLLGYLLAGNGRNGRNADARP